MKNLIQQGYAFLKLKQFEKADKLFIQAAAAWPKAEAPLKGLVSVAQAKKDFNLLAKRVDRLLEQFPDNLSARIIRSRGWARQGKFEELRTEIGIWLNELEHCSISIQIGQQLLSAIQYACTGCQKVEYLNKLKNVINSRLQNQSDQKVGRYLLAAEIYFALGDFSQLSIIVDQLKIGANSTKLKSLISVMDKYHSPNFPDFSLPKIFGIGLSKTATSSLNSALNQLGFYAIHWQNPHTRMLISPQDFFLFDGFSDSPVSYQFEMLYYTFPNSQFIYTTRTLESWISSIAFHYKNARNIDSPVELYAPSTTQRFDFIAGYSDMSLYGRHSTWKAAYLEYDSRVRNFFKDKPSARFLEFGICNGEGWEKLCLFLNCPIPATPFPRENQRSVRSKIES